LVAANDAKNVMSKPHTTTIEDKNAIFSFVRENKIHFHRMRSLARSNTEI
jgi:hypothetical protein